MFKPSMFCFSILVNLVFLGVASYCNADTVPIDFDQWEVKVSNGRIQTIQFSSHPMGEALESRVQSERGQSVNYAGRYHLFAVGCGTMCQSFIAVDVYTGKIIDSVTASAGACYFPDSSMIVVNPEIYQMYDGQLPDWAFTRYYRMTQDGFLEFYKSKEPYLGQCNN